MNEDEIKKNIFLLLKKTAPDTEPSELKPDENIRESLGIDSFDALQFIIALNEKLGIEIPEKDYCKTNTLRDLLAYIMHKIK
jgi:acyl carrier protein